MLAQYPEEYKLGACWANPISQKQAEYQRKQIARGKRQERILRNMTEMPPGHKDFMC